MNRVLLLLLAVVIRAVGASVCGRSGQHVVWQCLDCENVCAHSWGASGVDREDCGVFGKNCEDCTDEQWSVQVNSWRSEDWLCSCPSSGPPQNWLSPDGTDGTGCQSYPAGGNMFFPESMKCGMSHPFHLYPYGSGHFEDRRRRQWLCDSSCDECTETAKGNFNQWRYGNYHNLPDGYIPVPDVQAVLINAAYYFQVPDSSYIGEDGDTYLNGGTAVGDNPSCHLNPSS